MQQKTVEELTAEIEAKLISRRRLAQQVTAAEEVKKTLGRRLSSLDNEIAILYQERAGQKRLF